MGESCQTAAPGGGLNLAPPYSEQQCPQRSNVIAALDAAGVAYEVMPCDPDLADTAVFCEAYGIPPERSANAILVASRRPLGERAVCVVLATSRLDVNRTVRQRLGVKKASFASAEETAEATGMTIGGVTPLGLPRWTPGMDRRCGDDPRLGDRRCRDPGGEDPARSQDLVRASAAEVSRGWLGRWRRLDLSPLHCGPASHQDHITDDAHNHEGEPLDGVGEVVALVVDRRRAERDREVAADCRGRP